MAKTQYITAEGTASYPHLDKPDTFKGQEKYKTSIILDAAGFKPFKAALDDFMKNEKFDIRKPKVPWTQDEQDDTKYVLKASTSYKPLIFDSKNNALPDDARVGGGSRIRLLVEFYNYGDGVSLRLKQVQVIELKEWGGGSAFDVADGYTADTSSSGFSATTGDDDHDDGDDALSI